MLLWRCARNGDTQLQNMCSFIKSTISYNCLAKRIFLLNLFRVGYRVHKLLHGILVQRFFKANNLKGGEICCLFLILLVFQLLKSIDNIIRKLISRVLIGNYLSLVPTALVKYFPIAHSCLFTNRTLAQKGLHAHSFIILIIASIIFISTTTTRDAIKILFNLSFIQ